MKLDNIAKGYVDSVVVGSRNLLRNTDDIWRTVNTNTSQFYIDNFFTDTVLKAGQEYIFTWEAERISGAASIQVFVGAGTSGYQRDITPPQHLYWEGLQDSPQRRQSLPRERNSLLGGITTNRQCHSDTES